MQRASEMVCTEHALGKHTSCMRAIVLLITMQHGSEMVFGQHALGKQTSCMRAIVFLNAMQRGSEMVCGQHALGKKVSCMQASFLLDAMQHGRKALANKSLNVWKIGHLRLSLDRPTKNNSSNSACHDQEGLSAVDKFELPSMALKQISSETHLQRFGITVFWGEQSRHITGAADAAAAALIA